MEALNPVQAGTGLVLGHLRSSGLLILGIFLAGVAPGDVPRSDGRSCESFLGPSRGPKATIMARPTPKGRGGRHAQVVPIIDIDQFGDIALRIVARP